MNKRKLWYKTLINVLLVIYICLYVPIALLIGIIVYKAQKNPDVVPDIFGYKPLIVMSGSMEAEVYAGDLVFIKNVPANSLNVGNIIGFRVDDGTIVLHRVVKILTEDGKIKFQTKGDNNTVEDQNLVDSSKVEGIFVKRYSDLGSYLLLMQKPSFMYCVLTIGLILILFLFALDYKDSQLKMSKKELEEFKKFKKRNKV